jgi:hypothetical protein
MVRDVLHFIVSNPACFREHDLVIGDSFQRASLVLATNGGKVPTA